MVLLLFIFKDAKRCTDNVHDSSAKVIEDPPNLEGSKKLEQRVKEEENNEEVEANTEAKQNLEEIIEHKDKSKVAR